MSKVKIIKPIPTYANLPTTTTTSLKVVLPIAGTKLKEGSLVYLLRSLPDHFLLTDFYDHTQHYYNKIPIHNWNQYLMGPGLYQEWILSIKSARTPDEQNIELFQSSDSHVYGFRTTRDIVPDEPLLAWFSLPHLRAICEKIKLTKLFKVEEILKSTRCPRCKIDQYYLNVLVAHVLMNQCSIDSRDVFLSSITTSTCHPNTIGRTSIDEETKSKDFHHQSLELFSTNDVSSYKMSVLDGTRTLEFTSLDIDGKQRKGHLCLFCGKIYNRKYGYKPLRCQYCLRPFSDPSNLNKHVRLHSMSSSTIDMLPSVLSQESNINTDSDTFDDDL